MKYLHIVGRLFFVVSVAAMSGILPNQSAQAGEHGLTLDQCISIACERNPLVMSSKEEYKASVARERKAKAFSQPSFNLDSDIQPAAFDFNGSQEAYVGFSKSILFPGKRHLNKKYAGLETHMLLADIDLLKLDIAYQVKEAFYSILLTQEKQTYARQDVDLAQDFVEKTNVKFSAGDVPEVELIRAKVEAAKAVNELQKAKAAVKLAKARLNFYLARSSSSPLEVDGKFRDFYASIDFETLQTQALSFRPELKKNEIAIALQLVKKRQAHLSYLPDVELGVSRHRITGEGKWWDSTVSLPIPLFFWQPMRGEVAEVNASMRALQLKSEYLKQMIHLQVEESYRSFVTAENQIKLFNDEILMQAEKVYNMSLFSYQQGELNGIELIQARKTLNEGQIAYADALFSYNLALAAIEKSIAHNLEVK